jgi:hypothetical protein
VSKHHRQCRQVTEVKVNTVCVKVAFITWRCLTEHARTIRAAHSAHLARSVLRGWRDVTLEGKQLRQTILAFRAASLTSLVWLLIFVLFFLISLKVLQTVSRK